MREHPEEEQGVLDLRLSEQPPARPADAVVDIVLPQDMLQCLLVRATAEEDEDVGVSERVFLANLGELAGILVIPEPRLPILGTSHEQPDPLRHRRHLRAHPLIDGRNCGSSRFLLSLLIARCSLLLRRLPPRQHQFNACLLPLRSHERRLFRRRHEPVVVGVRLAINLREERVNEVEDGILAPETGLEGDAVVLPRLPDLRLQVGHDARVGVAPGVNGLLGVATDDQMVGGGVPQALDDLALHARGVLHLVHDEVVERLRALGGRHGAEHVARAGQQAVEIHRVELALPPLVRLGDRRGITGERADLRVLPAVAHVVLRRLDQLLELVRQLRHVLAGEVELAVGGEGGEEGVECVILECAGLTALCGGPAGRAAIRKRRRAAALQGWKLLQRFFQPLENRGRSIGQFPAAAGPDHLQPLQHFDEVLARHRMLGLREEVLRVPQIDPLACGLAEEGHGGVADRNPVLAAAEHALFADAERLEVGIVGRLRPVQPREQFGAGHVIQQGAGVRVVEHGEARGEPGLQRMLAEEPRAERVDRGDRGRGQGAEDLDSSLNGLIVLCLIPRLEDELGDAGAEFGGGIVGECHEEDAPGIHRFAALGLVQPDGLATRILRLVRPTEQERDVQVRHLVRFSGACRGVENYIHRSFTIVIVLVIVLVIGPGPDDYD